MAEEPLLNQLEEGFQTRFYGKVYERNRELRKVEIFSVFRDWMRSLPLKFALLSSEVVIDTNAWPSWAK